LDVNGLFYAIGHEPATLLVRDQVHTDDDGYIVTVPGTAQTSIKGVFAAGDVQDKKYRQAITSAGSGESEAPLCSRTQTDYFLLVNHRLYGGSRGRTFDLGGRSRRPRDSC